ncbi:MAG: hypothetical protein R8N23_06030 [Reichenbachiella sp.]|uniref:hypothetical protein n=1 Tax=Reichenbachiella sp. TaxID=2184521 RepID=UPI0029660F6C|nr:hypothetical protein [Reichenbachiella sp.]MDW3209404.1 hypothetical protein [Reichenbachiella sp.]
MKSGTAIKIILSIVVALTIFHFSILFKIIPYEITWGGRLKTDSEMYVFELISIVINLLLGTTLLIKGNYLKPIIRLSVVNVILWIFLILFGLNTIGNLFAETALEKSFSILTLALSILIWIVLKAKDNEHTIE